MAPETDWAGGREQLTCDNGSMALWGPGVCAGVEAARRVRSTWPLEPLTVAAIAVVVVLTVFASSPSVSLSFALPLSLGSPVVVLLRDGFGGLFASGLRAWDRGVVEAWLRVPAVRCMSFGARVVGYDYTRMQAHTNTQGSRIRSVCPPTQGFIPGPTYLWHPANWGVLATAVRTEVCRRDSLGAKASECCCCSPREQLSASSRSDAVAGSGAGAQVRAPPTLWLTRSQSLSPSAVCPAHQHVSRDTVRHRWSAVQPRALRSRSRSQLAL
jgi:hypothetical protein